MPVTDYSLPQSPAVPGTIASGINSRAIRSKTNASGGVIAYGRAVVQGTASDDVVLPAADKTGFVGIAVRTYMYENAQTADGAFGYANKRQIDVLTQGEIWVETEVAVAPGDAVFFRIVAKGDNTVVGKFNKTADATAVPADTAVAIPNARWITSTTGAGLARLEINLP
jgi:hypothetical protein